MLGEHRRRKVTTKAFMIFFRVCFFLVWVKRSEVLCLFALLPTRISAGSHYNHDENEGGWQ